MGDKWDNWDMKLYENSPCKNKQELMKENHQIIKRIGTLKTTDRGETIQKATKK